MNRSRLANGGVILLGAIAGGLLLLAIALLEK